MWTTQTLSGEVLMTCI